MSEIPNTPTPPPPPTEPPPPTVPQPKRRRRSLTWLIVTVLLFGTGLFVGRYVIPAQEFNYNDPLQFVTLENGERRLIFPTFWEAWDQLHANYIGELSDRDLYYGAVAGMIRAADDPYTVFSPPPETKQFEETINGSFSGVGIEIGVRNSAVTVIAPLDGSPADQAGIEEGDIILGVDGEPIDSDTTLDEVVRQIRGEEGQDVTLTVAREGSDAPQEVAITRGTIDIESVKLTIDDDGIAHLEITNFNSDTADHFIEAARQIKKQEARGIILDVRNNPGGFLESAVDISSRFLSKGTLVVSERGHQEKEYKATGTPLLIDLPVVVVVNGGSASASEILAGALRDNLNAPIIGTKTFGKGSVQEFIKLSDKSSLRVTVARWYTPNNTSIDENGIEPTVHIDQDPNTEEDEQLQQARDQLRQLLGDSLESEA